jgi:hypothetical protein
VNTGRLRHHDGTFHEGRTVAGEAGGTGDGGAEADQAADRPTRVEVMEDARQKAIGLIGRIAAIGANSSSDTWNSEPMRDLERMSAGVSTHPLHSIPRTEWEKIARDGIESSYVTTRNTIGRIVDKAEFNALDGYRARHAETRPREAGRSREFGTSSETRGEAASLVTRRTTAERLASSRAWELVRDMSKEGVRFFGRPASSPQMEELKGMTRNHDELTRSVRALTRTEWRVIAEDRIATLPEATRMRLGGIARDAAHTAGRALVEREVGTAPDRSAMPTRGPDYIVGPDAGMSALVAQASTRGRSR